MQLSVIFVCASNRIAYIHQNSTLGTGLTIILPRMTLWLRVTETCFMIDAVVSLLRCIAGSDPVCSLNVSSHDDSVIENDQLELMCGVHYSGNWAPSIHCHPTSNSSRTTTTRSTVIYTQQLLVTPSLNGATVSCTTDFVESNRRQIHIDHLTFADNTPTYVHTWTSPPLNVLCTRT